MDLLLINNKKITFKKPANTFRDIVSDIISSTNNDGPNISNIIMEYVGLPYENMNDFINKSINNNGISRNVKDGVRAQVNTYEKYVKFIYEMRKNDFRHVLKMSHHCGNRYEGLCVGCMKKIRGQGISVLLDEKYVKRNEPYKYIDKKTNETIEVVPKYDYSVHNTKAIIWMCDYCKYNFFDDIIHNPKFVARFDNTDIYGIPIEILKINTAAMNIIRDGLILYNKSLYKWW